MSLARNGDPISFAADVKPLFREKDRASMLTHFDLWSFDGSAA
jgi:hypothetical protein